MILEYDTTTDGQTEAEALIAALLVLHPDMDSASSAIGSFIVGTSAIEGEASNAIQDRTGLPTVTVTEHVDPEAAFGRPAPLDPAAAFGGAAPLSPAPAAPPAGAPTAGFAGVELDGEGMPWDARIHAATKTKTKPGMWKAKKGLDDATKASVTAELKAALGAVRPIETAPAPVATPGPDTSASATLASTPSPAPAASIPLPPAAPSTTGDATTPLPPATSGITPADIAAAQAAVLADTVAGSGQSPAAMFTGFMKKLTPLQTEGKVSAQDVATILAALGLNSLRDLSVRPDLIEEAWGMVEAYAASA